METKLQIGAGEGFRFPKIDISHPDCGTLKKFKLLYYDGSPMTPVYCNISEVWATAITESTPIYAVFNGGTNRLVILEKTPGNDWKEVSLNEVKNLYGLIWRMVCHH